jgi:hypothetical protein
VNLLRLFALAVGAILALPGPATAAGTRYQLLTGDDSSVTRRITEDLDRKLGPLFADAGYSKRKDFCVAIGPVALREAVMHHPKCVLLAAYTSSQVWRALVAGLPPARAAGMTVIYGEPAPADQLKLVALLYKRQVRIATIVGADTSFLKPVLQGSTEVEEYAQGDDINVVLNRIGKAEVLLATPDSTVYNTENFRNILLSTYRHNQAVIGFSADMVKAGALATTYSDISDINAQVAEIASLYLATGDLPAPQFPRYFSTIVNVGVAKSLNVEPNLNARSFERRPPSVRP